MLWLGSALRYTYIVGTRLNRLAEAYQETDSDEMSVVNAHLPNYLLSFLFVSMKAKTNFQRCIGYLNPRGGGGTLIFVDT